jgi:hypothetical protein
MKPSTQTIEQNLNPVPTTQTKPNLAKRFRAQQQWTPPTYPFLAYSFVKEPKRKTTHRPQPCGPIGFFTLLNTDPMQIGKGIL